MTEVKAHDGDDPLLDEQEKATEADQAVVKNNKKKTETGTIKGSPDERKTKNKSKTTLSEEDYKNISEAFAMSDTATGRNGAIPPKEVANVMRMLGQCPTELEEQELIIEAELIRRSKSKLDAHGNKKKRGRKQRQTADTTDCNGNVKPDNENRIAYSEFLTILDKKGKEPETEQNIFDAFRVFDVKGNGLISSKKLKKIMTGMGEKLSEAEVDEMIRQAECFNGDGKVKYKKFVKMMMEA